MHFSDKPGCEQFFDFFVDCCIAFRIEPSALLDDRLVCGVDVEPVDYD